MKSEPALSATLIPMAHGKSETEEWISPIGRSVADWIAERELTRPRRELAKLMIVRRTELGISQQELAERMGTSLSVVARLERGKLNFSVTTLQRLAKALDTKLVYGFEVEGGDRSLVVVP